MTDDYTHSTIEMRRRAANLLCQTSTQKVVAMASKSGKKSGTRVIVKNESDCKLLSLIGSGGRDRTADLGVMNPTL